MSSNNDDCQLNGYFLIWDIFVSVASDLGIHTVNYMMGHERFAVVFAYMAVGSESGLAAQIPGKLAREVILNNNSALGLRQDGHNLVAVEGHHPLDVQAVG